MLSQLVHVGTAGIIQTAQLTVCPPNYIWVLPQKHKLLDYVAPRLTGHVCLLPLTLVVYIIIIPL